MTAGTWGQPPTTSDAATERAPIGLVRIGQATYKDSRKQDSPKKGIDEDSGDELFISKRAWCLCNLKLREFA